MWGIFAFANPLQKCEKRSFEIDSIAIAEVVPNITNAWSLGFRHALNSAKRFSLDGTVWLHFVYKALTAQLELVAAYS